MKSPGGVGSDVDSGRDPTIRRLTAESVWESPIHLGAGDPESESRELIRSTLPRARDEAAVAG